MDNQIADQLVDDLVSRGFEVRIDRRNLPYGEQWQKELIALIGSSDTVVWLISASSVKSKWCNWELGEVQRTNKRLVPIRIASIRPEVLPASLGLLHTLPAEGLYEPSQHLELLISTLETDQAWIKDHTRLAEGAREWVSRGRSDDRLLRGKALFEAEAWRDRQPRKAPVPGHDTLDLILQSRRSSVRRQKLFSTVATAIATFMIILAGFAIWQWNSAVNETKRAEKEAEISSIQKELALSRLELQGNPRGALSRAMEVVLRNKNAKTMGISIFPDVHRNLSTTLNAATELPFLRGYMDGLYVEVNTIAERPSWSNISDRLLITTRDVVLLTDRKGRPVASPISAPDRGPSYANSSAWLINGTQTLFAVASGEVYNRQSLNVGVTIYDDSGGEVARVLTDQSSPFISLGHLKSQSLILAGNANGDLFKIDIRNSYTSSLILKGFGRPLVGIATISQGNDLVFLAYSKSNAKWPTSYGNSTTTEPEGSFSRNEASSVSRELGSSNIQIFAIGTNSVDAPYCLTTTDIPRARTSAAISCDGGGGISIWHGSSENAWPPFSVSKHIGIAGGIATAVAYSPELDAVAVGSENGSIQLFTMQGDELSTIFRHAQGPIRAIGFVRGSTSLLSLGSDTYIRQWDLHDLSGVPEASPREFRLGEKVVVSGNGKVRLFLMNPISKGERIEVVDKESKWKTAKFDFESPKEGDAIRIALSNDGSTAAWTDGGTVTVANRANPHKPLSVNIPPQRTVALLSLSAKGDQALIGLKLSTNPDVVSGEKVSSANPLILRLYQLNQNEQRTELIKEWLDEAANPTTVATGLPSVEGDGEMAAFVTGDLTGRLTLWSSTGTKLKQTESILTENSEQLGVQMIAASANGEKILAAYTVTSDLPKQNTPAALDGRILVWSRGDMTAASSPVAVRRMIEAVALDASGKIAAVAGGRGLIGDEWMDIQTFDTDTLAAIATIKVPLEFHVESALWIDESKRIGLLNRYNTERGWALALDDLLKIAAERVDSWSVSDQLDKLLHLAKSDIAIGNLQAAKASLRIASTLRDDVMQPWVQLGNLEFDGISKSGDAQAAERAYNKALEIAPFDPIALFKRGRLKYYLGQWASAEVDFESALRQPFSYIPIPRVIADIELNRSLHDAALQLRKSAYYEVASFRAYSIYQQKRWNDSLIAFTKLIEQYGGSARDYELRARAFASLGQVDAALADITLSISKLETSEGFYSGLDDFKSLGQTSTARQMLVCAFAQDAASWAVERNNEPATEKLVIEGWLLRQFDSCSRVWKENPNDFPMAREILASSHERLQQLGVNKPIERDALLPVNKRWSEIEKGQSKAEIEAFRKRFSGYPEAALAGLALAEIEFGRTPTVQENVLGLWHSDDMTQQYKIENGADGALIWRNQDPKNKSFKIGGVVGEMKYLEGAAPWPNIGKHMWAGNGDSAPQWGRPGGLVARLVTKDLLFFAYLDSRYEGGWLLRRSGSN